MKTCILCGFPVQETTDATSACGKALLGTRCLAELPYTELLPILAEWTACNHRWSIISRHRGEPYFWTTKVRTA
jgi:hypothetical protein